MEFQGVGEIVASRMLHLVDESGNKHPVSVFIGKPQPAREKSGYECPYQIIGIGSQATSVSHGRDSIEALKTAFVLVGNTLHQLNDELSGKLVWEGAPAGDLGFPVVLLRSRRV
jgi:hypothetical protein